MEGLFAFVGMCSGAIIAGLAVVLYNTSAQTAVLEGGRGHFSFHFGVGAMAAGGVIGALLGGLVGWLAGPRLK